MRPCPSIWSSSHRSVSRIPFAIIAFIVFFTEPFSYRFHFLEQRILFFLRFRRCPLFGLCLGLIDCSTLFEISTLFRQIACHDFTAHRSLARLCLCGYSRLLWFLGLTLQHITVDIAH